MIELKINNAFKTLIPPLTAEEFKQLENNIISDGIRDSICVWNGFIIDGHNRYEIALKHGLQFNIKEMNFDCENDCIEWIIKNQFGRRNINNYQRSLLALRLEDLFKAKAKENLKTNKDNANNMPLLKSAKAQTQPIDTRKELAKIADVSHDTIAKVKKIEEKAPEKIKEKLTSGEITINQAYKEIKNEEKKENYDLKKSEFEKPIIKTNTKQIIWHGDCLEIIPTFENNEFDLLLTDPPYGMDFKSGWSDKGKIENDKIADTVKLYDNFLKETQLKLKQNAHFYIFGNIEYITFIKPIIEKYLNLKNILIWDRKIIGMGDLKTFGRSYDIIYFGYNKVWKDLNGTRDKDILSYNRVDPINCQHPTEKPIELLEYIIKKSTNENDKVIDPFAGGGSSLIACKNTNRLATGIEIEEKFVRLINAKI